MSKASFRIPARMKSADGGLLTGNKSRPLSLGSCVDVEHCCVDAADFERRIVAVPESSKLMVPLMFTVGDGIDMMDRR